jgi:hypothetical protein
MSDPQHSHRLAQCQCSEVAFDLEGQPIMTVACYCSSCQEAAEQIQELTGAPPILDQDGGTHFVMYRKDRIDCRLGRDRLREHRLTPASKTRRVVAACCNTAIFLEVSNGHWLSVYKDRLDPTDRPPLEMRTMTEAKRPDVTFTDDIPSPPKHTARFMWKLLTAWIAMGFKTPRIDYVGGKIDGARN